MAPTIRMKLEKALAHIEDGELVEDVSKAIRVCKTYLDPNYYKRISRPRIMALANRYRAFSANFFEATECAR